MSKVPLKPTMPQGTRKPLSTRLLEGGKSNTSNSTTNPTTTLKGKSKNVIKTEIVVPRVVKERERVILPSSSYKLVIKNDRESIFKNNSPRKTNTNPEITDLDFKDLLNLTYQDKTYIINLDDKDVIIEIIGMLYIYTLDYIIEFLEDAPNKEWIFWDQKYMNIGKVSVDREILINRVEEVGVKGVGKCRYCTSTELVFAQKQVNSGDEPMKVFVKCVLCGQHWKQG